MNYSSLLVQGMVIGYSFTLVRKGYDNHHSLNKPQIENGSGVWMTSHPEEMVLGIWGFWKRVSWRLTLNHVSRQLSFWLWVRVESWGLDFDHWRCSWVFRISTDKDLKHNGMRSAFVGSDSMVSIVRIVSLSSCRRTELRS